MNGVDSLDKCLLIIKKRIDQTPEGHWVLGSGWNKNLWDGCFPTRQDLDRLSGKHPICLEARDAHTSWVNSLALKIAEVDSSSTFDSTGGILKDRKGEPTGIILEEARNLVWKKIPNPPPAERLDSLMQGLQLAYQNGLSGVHCMETVEDFEAYQTLHRSGELKLRVVFYHPIRYLDDLIDAGFQSGFGDEWLRFGGMKLFMDGALGGQTALMLEPYEGSQNYGIQILDQETADQYVMKAAEHNIACAIHAIGDKANRMALKAFEYQKKNLPNKKLRQRIEHCQLIPENEISRFAQLDVVASMQAIHIPEDIDAANRYWGTRSSGAYAFRSLLNSGATLAFGSDVPIETCNVFEGIYAALKRTKRGDDKSWYPEQRLSLKEIIYAYTMGAAYASGEENIKGSLAAGKLSDFMVLSDDIFEISPEEMLNLKVTWMVIGGDVVYQRD